MPTRSKHGRPPPRQPPPVTESEIIRDIHKRIVRMETRLGRTMEHLGLDPKGDPLPEQRQS